MRTFSLASNLARLHRRLPAWFADTYLTALRQPRAGCPLDGKVAVVFSLNYQVLESVFQRHPFDTWRLTKTFRALLELGIITADQVYVPKPLSNDEIRLIHSDHFIEQLSCPKAVAQYLEWPFIEDLNPIQLKAVIEPFRFAAGGTLLAARQALLWGLGINLGGGFHHAKPRYGEGFCLFADIPIAIRQLRAENRLGRSLVIDLDVHQGNGTVVCLEPEDQCCTFSMHQEHIYPSPKEESDLDIELPTGTGDQDYLDILADALPKILEQNQPELVFYVAGCDTLVGDPLASLAMTGQGLQDRDQMVVSACRARNIPVIMTLAGGYRADAWRVQAHSIANIIRSALQTTD